MSINLTSLRADLAAMRDDLPSSLVWSGQTISVTASPVMRSNDVSAEGVFSVREIEAYAVITDFTDSVIPEPQAVVQVDGIKYHITERETDPVGVRMMLRRV